MALFDFFRRAKKPRPKASRGSQGGIITGDEIQDFLENEALLFVTSTSHAAAQYFPDANKLMIEYQDGHAYLYSDVSPREAEDYARAPSKGIWGVENLIGRENLDGHAHWHGGPSRKRVTKLH